MPNFLDPDAPSIDAEYSRYLDGDLLGKLIAKNFLTNVLGCQTQDVFIPLGRYGNAATKYAKRGTVQRDPGDGHVDYDERRITFEIKCARINVANRSKGHLEENWAFTNILRSPGRAAKKYDVLLAIGLYTLGLEDNRYWNHLDQVKALRAKQGRMVVPEARPHEASFLPVCSFFIMPMKAVPNNYFRVNLSAVEKKFCGRFRAWGDEAERCKALWNEAIAGAPDV